MFGFQIILFFLNKLEHSYLFSFKTKNYKGTKANSSFSVDVNENNKESNSSLE